MAQKQPVEERFSLDKIKEALVLKAVGGKLFQLLRSFFREMDLVWGETETAHAERRGDKPVIVLGRAFFGKEVQNESEAAEIVLHEILHHVFRHLLLMPELEAQGYSQDVQNLAMDAVINAYLADIGAAEFMRRYYDDEGPYAFLRPGSTEFRRGIIPLKRLNERLFWKFEHFYDLLSRLHVDLKESLNFFKENFPDPPKKEKKKLLGSHGDGKPGAKSGEKSDTKSSSKGKDEAKAPQGQRGGKGRGENIFDAKDALRILEELGAVRASQKAKSNFAKVMQKITTSVKKPGALRTGVVLTRRVPAKLGRRDLLRVEMGRDVFTRSDFHTKVVWIFFDYSGSMDVYAQFCIDLARSLTRSGIQVRVVIWADGIQEVPLQKFLKGEIPEVGGGTQGEVVTQFLRDQKIAQAVLITDNAAGEIRTKVSTKVHLCLVKGGETSGSFINRSVIPNLEVHELEPGE